MANKGTFNQGWWNCYENFASEFLDANPYAEGHCQSVLRGAGITRREAQSWLNRTRCNDPRVQETVRDYLNNLN